MKMVRNLTTDEQEMIRRRKKMGRKSTPQIDPPIVQLEHLLKESTILNHYFNDNVGFTLIPKGNYPQNSLCKMLSSLELKILTVM